MCLYTNNSVPYRAKEDIICYKVINPLTENMWESVFQQKKFPYGIVEEKQSFVITSIFNLKHPFMISSGGFHAFINKESASYLLDRINSNQKYKIVKCIIPKNTLYFLGSNNDICAKILNIIKTIY